VTAEVRYELWNAADGDGDKTVVVLKRIVRVGGLEVERKTAATFASKDESELLREFVADGGVIL
jgi:hypothetical protein